MSEIIEDFNIKKNYKLSDKLYFLKKDLTQGELIIIGEEINFIIKGNEIVYKASVLPISIYVMQRTIFTFKEEDVDCEENETPYDFQIFSSLRLLNKYRNLVIRKEIEKLEALKSEE